MVQARQDQLNLTRIKQENTKDEIHQNYREIVKTTQNHKSKQQNNQHEANQAVQSPKHIAEVPCGRLSSQQLVENIASVERPNNGNLCHQSAKTPPTHEAVSEKQNNIPTNKITQKQTPTNQMSPNNETSTSRKANTAISNNPNSSQKVTIPHTATAMDPTVAKSHERHYDIKHHTQLTKKDINNNQQCEKELQEQSHCDRSIKNIAAINQGTRSNDDERRKDTKGSRYEGNVWSQTNGGKVALSSSDESTSQQLQIRSLEELADLIPPQQNPAVNLKLQDEQLLQKFDNFAEQDEGNNCRNSRTYGIFLQLEGLYVDDCSTYVKEFLKQIKKGF